MCCNNKCENNNCEPKQTCERNHGGSNYLILIVLYILLAIILGSYIF